MKKNCKLGGLSTKIPPILKTLIIMKLSIILVSFASLTLSYGSIYAQDTKLNLQVSGSQLKDVFKNIESQSEFSFMYDNSMINVEREVTIRATEKTIYQVLDQILDNNEVRYQIIDRHIVLIPKEENQEERAVTGKVTSADDQGGLPGVNVILKGTSSGTVTDVDGNYSLIIPDEAAILVFSSVGFVREEVQVGNQAVIDIIMTADVTAMEELVIVGYGTKKKRDITGSIASISGESLSEVRAESFAQALQGQAAGVYVKSNTGQPGGGVSVRVRGIGGINNSEPLYIIDGVQIGGTGDSDDSNPLASINMNDIASIEVLKDASSAAIYGARAANGVVIITTRRGESGAPKFSYTGSYGVQNLTNPNNFALLNAQEYATVVNQTVMADGGAAIFGGNDPLYSPDIFPAPSTLGEGTNWLDAIINKNAKVQEHQVAVSGGSDKNKYYLSLNYLEQEGIMLNTFYKRYNLRVNTDNDITKSIKIGNSLLVSNSSSNQMDQKRMGETGVLNNALTISPTLNVYNPDGSFAGPTHGFFPPKRNSAAELMKTERNNVTTNVIGNVYGLVSIVDGLSFKTSFSANMRFNSNDHFEPTYSEGTNIRNSTAVSALSINQNSWIWNNVLSYTKDFDKHHVAFLGGTEAISNEMSIITGDASYTDNAIRIVSSQGSETSGIDQFKTGSSLISYFGNASYNFDNRYYLEANIRRDGSSRFGANNRVGIFPSLSAAWRISSEEFMPESISDMKFRASYGKVGNDKIGDYSYIAGIKNIFYGFGDVNGVFSNGLAIDQLGNPNLKWETSEQINLGLDLYLLDNKLSITADYFETTVTDMLLGLPIPAITGISASTGVILQGTITSNAGSLMNKGIELEASYRDKIGEISYSVGANITTFNNEIIDIGDNDQIWGQTIQGENVSRTVVGGSLGEFYGYTVEGIFQTQAEVDAAAVQNENTAPGDYRYKDLNGDNVINADDRGTIGSPIPDFTYGLNLNLGYKQFTLSMLWTGSQGNEIFNANRIDLEASGRTNFNKSKTVLNSWNGPGTSNTIARRIQSDPNQNRRVSSIFVEDGSYFALRNLKIGYNLPSELTSKLKISNAQVYVSGQNLLMFTKYSGFDPEVGNYSGSNLNAGIDNDLYPHASTVNLGVVVNF